MLALCINVTFFRPFSRVHSKAYLQSRSQCGSVTIFKLSTTPGTLSCSSCAYSPSVFIRIRTMSMSSWRVRIP